MRPAADYWRRKLGLETHIEGGSYRRTYASGISIPQHELPAGFHGSRPSATAIYFLLEKDQFSALHRIASDEGWHFYFGDPLIVYEMDAGGQLIEHLLGNHPENNESFQCVIKAGHWFGAPLKSGGEYALVGCTVSPGFDFADFELANRASLLLQYPQQEAIIRMLTR